MVSSAACFLGTCLISLIAAQGAELCAERSLREREGVLTSPNFPEQYSPNTCTTWFVHNKPYGSVVIVSLAYLDLPQDSDEGSCSSNYIELGSPGYKKVICGRQAKSFTSFPYDMQFYIKFVSGPIPYGHGFRLEYFVGPWYQTHCPESQFHCGSGKCIPGSWKCNGRHECKQGEDEQSCHDVLKISNSQLEPWRSTTLPPLHPPAVYSPECSHVLHNRTGKFKLLVSPSVVYKTCSWLIDVPGNVDKIVLRFLRLDIYSDAYIWVYKGRQANISNTLGMFDGGSKIQTVTAHSSTVFVEFRLAFDNPTFLSRDLYFVAKYSAFPSDSDTFSPPTPTAPMEDSCYHQLFQRVGNFSMPSMPFHSSAIRSCIWHIYKPYAGSFIHLLISDANLQGRESIKVFDGPNSLAPTLAILDNQHPRLPLNVHSTGNQMVIYFTTSQQSRYGSGRWIVFEAKYHFEDSCELAREIHCGSEDNTCYKPEQGCDGTWDCPLSGVDEQGCDLCPEHSYTCGVMGLGHSNKCYFKEDRCSGTSHCPNDADELNCSEQLCSESRNLFLCANKHCILSDFMCDETDDCGDNSDEEGCSLGNSRKVIVAAVVGALLCSLLLVLSLGCACKFYYLRHHPPHHPHPRGPRYDTPLTRLQAEMFRRRAPPPPYHEAMLTSRPYEEAVRDYLAQSQPPPHSADTPPAHTQGGSAEQGGAGNADGDPSVHNLISLMDFSEQGQDQNFSESSARLEIHLPSDSSSDSESEEEEGEEEGEDTVPLAEHHSGQMEMTATVGREIPNTPQAAGLQEDVSEDSASATLSADDGTEMTSLPGEEGRGGDDGGKEEEEGGGAGEEGSDKENTSDADSVCILCLDEDPSALDDGSDTTCLLQDP